MQVAVVNWLIARGADVNAAMSGTGVTPLIAAAQKDHARAVAALAAAGAELDAAAADGRTALAVAAQYDSLRAASTLLQAGARVTGAYVPPANLHASGRLGESARAPKSRTEAKAGFAAPQEDAVDAVDATLNAEEPQPDPDADDAGAIAPLDPLADKQPVVIAVRRGHADMVRLLVEGGGAAADTLLADGRSLLLATCDGFPVAAKAHAGDSDAGPSRLLVRPEMAELLLALGADRHLMCVERRGLGVTGRGPAAHAARSPAQAVADGFDVVLKRMFLQRSAGGDPMET
jgi:hypothetical protein